MPSASVRIDLDTYRELQKLAASMGMSVADTVALAVRGLRQDQMAATARQELSARDVAWLDADLS